MWAHKSIDSYRLKLCLHCGSNLKTGLEKHLQTLEESVRKNMLLAGLSRASRNQEEHLREARERNNLWSYPCCQLARQPIRKIYSP